MLSDLKGIFNELEDEPEGTSSTPSLPSSSQSQENELPKTRTFYRTSQMVPNRNDDKVSWRKKNENEESSVFDNLKSNANEKRKSSVPEVIRNPRYFDRSPRNTTKNERVSYGPFDRSRGMLRSYRTPMHARSSTLYPKPFSDLNLKLLHEKVSNVLSNPGLEGDTSLLFILSDSCDARNVQFKVPKSEDSRIFLLESFQQLHANTSSFLMALGKEKKIKESFQTVISSEFFYDTSLSPDLLDFQGSFLTLLFILSHPSIETSPNFTQTAVLLSTAKAFLPTIFANFYNAIERALYHKALYPGNKTSNLSSSFFIPVSFTQAFYPMVKFLTLLFRRFEICTKEIEIKKNVEKLEKFLNQWKCDFEEKTLVNTREEKNALDIVFMEFQNVKNMMTETINVTQKLKLLREREKKVKLTNPDDSWKNPPVEPPQGLFDNDKINYREIKLIPTLEEIFYDKEFVLPGNFPFSPSAHWIEPGPERLLDTQFRLLRSDMLNAICLGIKTFVDFLKGGKPVRCGRFRKNLEYQQVNLMVYTQAKVNGYCFDKSYGLCHRVQFELPNILPDSRSRFWENCLQKDGLVCLLYKDKNSEKFGQLHFAVIASRDKNCEKDVEFKTTSIKLNFSDQDFDPFTLSFESIFMLEFKGLLFESYRPILAALQKIQAVDLPFSSILSPTKPPALQCLPVELPHYLFEIEKKFTFKFLEDLKSKKKHVFRDFFPESEDSSEYASYLAMHSTLDKSQANSLLGALKSNVCCIQGPPGSGKTYIGVQIVKALLEVNSLFESDYFMKKIRILVMSLTNHALDQFLCHLSDEKIEGMLRISSKKNPSLENYDWYKRQRQTLYSSELRLAYYEIKDLQEDIESKLQNSSPDLQMIWQFVKKNENDIAKNLEWTCTFETQESCLTYWLENREPPPKANLSKAQKNKTVNPTKEIKENFIDDNDRIYSPLHINIFKENQDWQFSTKSYKGANDEEDGVFFQKNENNLVENVKAPENKLPSRNAPSQDSLEYFNLEENFELLIGADEIAKRIDSFALPKIEEKSVENYSTAESDEEISMDEDCEERLDADNSLFKSLHYHDSLLQDSMGFWKNKKIQPINNASNKHTDFHEKYKINLENPDLFLEKDIDIETESEVGNLDLFKRLSLKRDSDVESNNSTHSEYLESLSNFDLSNEERSDTNSGEHMHKYIWSMELEERRVLYDSWVKQVSEACNKSLIDLKLALKNKINEYKELESINMSEMIAEASVVGITTTRASKYIDALKAWKPTVILCEEAGEVLEAHVIASLSKSTKQLILIGDHKQLRPRIQEFNLSVESRSGKQYRLDVSLFERLMDPKCHLPLYTLQEQRRMKPIISQFIRQTVYSELSDGKDVLNRNPIRGMQKDVFFMTHSHPQSSNEELFGGLGHSNRFEVEMIVETVKYLFKQGYTCEQMVILTPYLFQARMLRRAMSTVEPPPKSHAPSNIVRVETVDNFQGEEADIILISLVRSTFDSGSDYGIGFLKIENRITVLLSRARNGMYIFGNAPLLEQHSKMWKTIINLMKEQNLIDIKLPIICANHPEDVRYIENPKDFLKVSPSGGCLKLCNFRLKCGHSCPEPCHIEDQEHTKYKCKKPCNHHFPDCGHRCSKLCYEICDKCKIILQDVQLPKCGHMLKSPQCHVLLDLSKVVCEEIVTHQRDCGHILKFKCFKDPKSFLMSECKKQVAYARPCGHTFLLLCHQNTESYISANPCNSIMGPVLLPNCGHILKKPKCHELEDLNNVKCEQQVSSKRFCQHTINLKCYENVDTIRCSENCGKLLKCGHPCHNLCYKCIGKPDEAYKHSLCTSTCDKLLPCFHKCKEKCHINECSLKCKEQCLKSKCKHKNCSNLCNYPCEPCLGKCDWSCVHQGNCPYPCGYPCLRLPCDKNCAKKLKCGHPCPSVCGEICPSSKYCLKCSKANNTLNAQEYELLQNHACNLNEDPLMFLKCGHFFPISELDSKFSLQSYYEKSDGKWLKPIYPQKWVQSYLSCPKCSFPVCRIDANRYARIINMTILMDSSTLEITKVSNNFNIAASFIRRFDANVQLSDLTRIQELDQKFLTFSEKFFNSASNQMALKILRSINLELFLGMKPFYLLYNSPQYICVHANYYILKARMTMLLLKTQIKKFSSISDFQQLNEYHKEASFYYTQAIQCYIQSNANISILELELENAYNFIYHKIKFLVFAVFGEFRTLNPHTQREDIQWELHLIDNFLRHLHRVQAHDGKYKRVSYTSYFHDYTWTLKTIGGLLSEKWQILANPNKMHLYVHKSSVASFLNSCHRIKRFSFHFKDEEVDFSSKDINIPWHICSEGHFYVKTLKNSKKNAKCLECGGELLKKLD